MAELIPGSSNQ